MSGEAPASSARLRVLLTGATGYLGQGILRTMRAHDGFEVDIVTGHPDAARVLGPGTVGSVYSYTDALSARIAYGNYDALLHAGFARPHHGSAALAHSLWTTSELFDQALKGGTRAIVNVSSRSVYGSEIPVPWTEESPTSPQGAYGMAKRAAEIMLAQIGARAPHASVTSVRLGTVMGGGAGLVDVFVLARFVLRALAGEPIQIRGGSQNFDVLDLRDASDAFASLLRMPCQQWSPIYNLTSPATYNIRLLAERCVAIASGTGGGARSRIDVVPGDDRINYLLDSSRFRRDTGWKPRYSLDDTIRSLVEFYRQQVRV